MGRTRLRGLEIGGIQIGIEVPESFAWSWPETAIADHRCLPRDPDVHVGVRVGRIEAEAPSGERFALGTATFEVARRGRDWLVTLSRGGRRIQRALFDDDLRSGEVVISPEHAGAGGFPLPPPLDEWIVLHRHVARGGLLLTAQARAESGRAVLRLGSRPVPEKTAAWRTPTRSLLRPDAVLVREARGRPRVFATPWSTAVDAGLGSEAPLSEILVSEPSNVAFRRVLDPGEAAERLVAHACVPLNDDALLDRVLDAARGLAARCPVVEVGTVRRDAEGAGHATRAVQSAARAPVFGAR